MSEPTTKPLIHARVLVYEGHAYSPWAGSGRRQYRDHTRADRQVELVCGRGLDDVHSMTPWAWVTLRSKRTREARLVTCPVCAKRIAEAGFKYAPSEAAA